MNSEDVAAGLMVLLVLAAIIGGVFWMQDASRSVTDAKCKAQFGQEWVGKYEHYGTNFCVNSKGEVKVPQ